MAQVIWTEPALADLQEVHDFIARDSPLYARVTVQRIHTAIERLITFPLSGRTVPEFPDSPYREIIERGYRILYRFLAEDELVVIVTVTHGRRPLRPLDEGG